jgi:hypothetical protein
MWRRRPSADPPSENVRSIRPDINNARARSKLEAEKVTSDRQKAANRANARHSTGPKTPEGKAVVRANALRHGLFARDVVLPEEDADAFEDLWNRVRANLSPEGPIEEFLVDRVVDIMWRLQRAKRAETALLHSRIHRIKADQFATLVRSHEQTFPWFPSETVITDKTAKR